MFHEPNVKLVEAVNRLKDGDSEVTYNDWGTQALLIDRNGDFIIFDTDAGVGRQIVMDVKIIAEIVARINAPQGGRDAKSKVQSLS